MITVTKKPNRSDRPQCTICGTWLYPCEKTVCGCCKGWNEAAAANAAAKRALDWLLR